MGWSSLSFPFGSLLTAAKMTQVASNFASLAYQESGAPQLGGQGNIGVGSGLSVPAVGSFGMLQVGSGMVAPQVSSFGLLNVSSSVYLNAIAAPGTSSLGALDVHSQYTLGGNIAKALIQSVFKEVTSQYQTSAIGVYSTYMVCSITPKFLDSLIKVRAVANGIAVYISGNSRLSTNLTRGAGGVPGVVLTNCSGTFGQAPILGDGTMNIQIWGQMPMYYEESSPGSGTPVQYAIRWAEVFSGKSYVNWGQMNVEEWR